MMIANRVMTVEDYLKQGYQPPELSPTPGSNSSRMINIRIGDTCLLSIHPTFLLGIIFIYFLYQIVLGD